MSAAALCAVAVGATACHGVLDVSDPTLIQDKDIANAAGANARRVNVVFTFSNDVAFAFLSNALFSDELRYNYDNASNPLSPPYASYAYDLDRHDDVTLLEYAEPRRQDRHLATLDEVFAKSSLAVNAMRAYGAANVRRDYLAQLFAIRGFVVVQMAEDICPGFPIDDISADNRAVYNPPYSYTDAVTYGIAQLDSALAEGQDSTQFLDFARVVKGRALLDLGKYAEADSVVSSVPTSFVYTNDPSVGNVFYINYHYEEGYPIAVGDHEGGNGLPFVSAQDPRVPSHVMGVSYADTTDTLYAQDKYLDVVPIVIASGIEARLIQSEAALNTGNANWLTILNTLRATVGLGALSDPGTTAARVDLLYSERAFWLYLTGRRLGDMRRLVLNYGRDPSTVYPTGSYGFGDAFGVATAIPFSQVVQSQTNPHITAGCTTR